MLLITKLMLTIKSWEEEEGGRMVLLLSTHILIQNICETYAVVINESLLYSERFGAISGSMINIDRVILARNPVHHAAECGVDILMFDFLQLDHLS